MTPAERTARMDHHHRRTGDGVPPRWQFDRKVSLSHVLAALGLVGAVMVAGNALDRRVTRLEDRQLASEAQLAAINQKLDDLDAYLRTHQEKKP